jgi:hypothetical protein
MNVIKLIEGVSELTVEAGGRIFSWNREDAIILLSLLAAY